MHSADAFMPLLSFKLPLHAVLHAIRHQGSLSPERIENLLEFLRYVAHVWLPEQQL